MGDRLINFDLLAFGKRKKSIVLSPYFPVMSRVWDPVLPFSVSAIEPEVSKSRCPPKRPSSVAYRDENRLPI
jgi:hypothetical protein